MKKRKIKLFASVASLAMVAAVMGVGVWAATQQAVSVSSTIGFEASGIAATVGLAITSTGELNGCLDTSVTKIGSGAAGTATIADIAHWQNSDNQVTMDAAQADPVDVTLAFADGNDNGFIDNGSTIVYTFTITPSVTVDQELETSLKDITVTATITQPSIDGVTAKVKVGEGVENAATATGDLLTTNSAGIKVVVTYTVNVDGGATGLTSVGATDGNLGDINIQLTKKAQA